MNKINTKKGFTIIEVVLVLAIAGLIFLMVFLALPALQRNQRDTQRKSDLSRVQAQLQNFQSNNRGSIPGDQNALGTNDANRANATGFIARYMLRENDSFQDPNGTIYQIRFGTAVNGNPGNGTIGYMRGQICGNDGVLTPATGNNKVALTIALEGGGTYCLNN